MNRFIGAVTIFFMIISVRGQDISRREADSLLGSLSKAGADTTHINSLLKLALFEIHKPGEFKIDLDSAALFINHARQINNNIKSVEADGYITLIESHFEREKGLQKEAKASVERAIQVLNNGKDKLQLAQAYMELSDYYDYQDPDQLPKKIQLVEQAVTNFKLSGNTERMAFALRMLGEYYSAAADSRNPDNYYNTLATALEKLKLSVALYQSIHYNKLQGVYEMLGEVYFTQRDYVQSLNYELMALKAAENVHDTTMQLCQINNHIGITLLQLREYEKAANYFKNAIQVAGKYKDNETIYLLASNVVDVYIKSKKPLDARAFLENISKRYAEPKNNIQINYRIATSYINIYMLLKQYHLAKPYCDQLLSLINYNKIGQTELNYIYSILIKYYIASNQYSSALIYLNKNNSLMLKIGDAARIGNNNYLWFVLDTARHHYKSAISHLLISNKIKDSIYSETRSRQAQQLQVQFETAKKEDEIKLLNQKRKLEQASLEQANLVKNVTIGGIILALIIAGLFYRQYRQKRKANLVITHKNELLQHLLTEKEWLLKEVHHRVKNNLHTVICLLESQAAYLENDALKAIEKSQHRIYAMSLIHQKLYQSEDIKTINMKEYLPEFIRYLGDSFDTSNQVRFQLDIEPIKLSATQAIPIALIINEAVTNSIKYAFPFNRKGEISIAMHRVRDQIKLEVADNGIGMNASIKDTELNSLGLQLIKGLSEEIRAHIEFENNMGTKISVTFYLDTLMEFENNVVMPLEKEVYI
ncbi:MAG TPA: sensor histidine kinase [Chitinophagaceae bacterium]|nr:sensor histidine kinase [Chitinophagaceae bacterium]